MAVSLRPFATGDHVAFARMNADPAMDRWVPGCKDPELCKVRVRMWSEARAAGDVDRFADMVLDGTGEPVGYCMVYREDEDVYALVIAILTEHHGKGYARAAVAQMIDNLKQTPFVKRLLAVVEDGNDASGKLCAKFDPYPTVATKRDDLKDRDVTQWAYTLI